MVRSVGYCTVVVGQCIVVSRHLCEKNEINGASSVGRESMIEGSVVRGASAGVHRGNEFLSLVGSWGSKWSC